MRSDSSDGTPKESFIAGARRAQILQAAVRVLVANGYTGTSLARIAAEAGVAKGVVSYHFRGKDELLEQVVIDAYTRGAEEMVPKIMAQPDARGMLRAYLRGNLEFLDANRDQIVALGEVILNLRRPDGSLRFDEEGSLEVVRPLADLLAGGQRSGEFADFDPLTIAYVLRDAIDGVSGRLRVDPDYDIAGFAEQFVGFAERAIHRSPADPADSAAAPSTSDQPSDDGK
ncbi:MAG TPA: TetR/AcrR family transcriptional regulator [Microlunatus sp.]